MKQFSLPGSGPPRAGGGEGQMTRGPAIFRGPSRASNQLMKNIIICYTKFLIYVFLNIILLTFNYNQLKLQASE